MSVGVTELAKEVDFFGASFCSYVHILMWYFSVIDSSTAGGTNLLNSVSPSSSNSRVGGQASHRAEFNCPQPILQ